MSTTAKADLVVLANDKPLTFARSYLSEMQTVNECLTLRHWCEEFYRWRHGCYSPLKVEELRAHLWKWLDGQRFKNKESKVRTFHPESRDVTGVVDALRAECQVFDAEMPAWLESHKRPPATDVVAFRNGLLDVGRYIRAGDTVLIPATPLWFSRTVLPYDFSQSTACAKWKAFLADVFDEDEERIALLQEWFGYCLTLDTAQQKMMLMVGPPRSGKGTITRMMERLVGRDNCATPSLSSLGDRFGLTTLLGKTVAMCSDAHLGRDKDTTGILETLKNLVGEDSRDVERKNRDAISSVRLYARFTIAVNELPRLTDASAAMVPRLLVLPMHKSYVGREDRALDGKLAVETPGVLLWALDGLRGLRKRGCFTEPKVSVDELLEFERLSSPLKAFVEDCCNVGPSLSVQIDTLYRGYRKYCETVSAKPLALSNFGAKLRAAAPSIGRSRPREDGKRVNVYDGIDLKLEWVQIPTFP